MPKRWRQMIKALLCMTLMISTFSNILLEVEAAPATIITGDSYYLEPYVEGVGFGMKTIQGGGFAYCLDIHKQVPQQLVMYLSGEKDAGFAYLLENGYPNKSMTGNQNYDYYITQAAVWWYLDETTGSDNLTERFKTNGSDPYGLRPFMKQLVDGALEAKKTGYITPQLKLETNRETLTLSSDKKYYESAPIKIVGTKVSGEVEVSFQGAPSNTDLINSETGSWQNKYQVGNTFQVRVPVESVTTLSNTITLKATATGRVNKAYEYQPQDKTVQSVVPAVLYEEEKALTATMKVTLDTSQVSITKIDQATKKPLAGATLVLKDALGKVITSWVSTTNAHIIQNLKDGTYTIEETEAPKGYKRSQEKTTFTLSKGKRKVNVTISNKAVQKVVQITKIDQKTKQPLKGAHLRVVDAKGKVIADFVTTEEVFILENIEDGTYTVEELEAPEGYIKTTQKYTFTISSETPTAQVVIENSQEEILYDVPNTSHHASLFPPLLGILLLFSSIGLIRCHGKKENE